MVELLIVVCIIAILAALTFPVLSSAKRSGYETTTISNLRQCGQALELYAPEAVVPVLYDHAKVALERAPTIDSADYSRYRRDRSWPMPFIGSYGYLRGASPFDAEASVRELMTEIYVDRPHPVMASIWNGEPKVSVFDPPLWEPWKGTPPHPMAAACLSNKTCLLPDRISYLMSDGSAKPHRFRPFGSTKTNPMFLWWYVFMPPQPFSMP